MVTLILQRLVQSVAVMLTVAIVAFVLFQFVGDPVNNMLPQEATMADRQQLRADLGLDDPIPVQFATFIANTVQGDFGISYRLGRPVGELIRERLPATIELATLSSLFAFTLGVAGGVYTALRRGRPLATVVMWASLVGVSLPTFLIGILLIAMFSVQLGWLPSFGRGDTISFGFWRSSLVTLDGIRSMILPAITLGLFQLTLIMRLVRAEMLDVLRSDYVKFARARGLPERVVNFRHALKNTMVPVITITGLQLGQVLAFAIITETVFQWPGVGLLFIDAIRFVDIPVMSAYLVLIALFFVLINLGVDILYAAIDPRLRLRGGQ